MSKSIVVPCLTESLVQNHEFVSTGQILLFEEKQSGFGLAVGKMRKSYIAQTKVKVNGKWQTKRRVVGDASTTTTKAARVLAVEAIAQLKAGTEQNPKADEITLGEGWTHYRKNLIRKNRSARTIEGYASHMKLHLTRWYNKTLIELSQNTKEIADFHDELTERRGKYCANGVLRTLSAIYNYNARFEPALRGQNPVFYVDKNPEQRRQSAMKLDELADWFDQLHAIKNLSRRGFHLFTLLTGSRPDALKKSTWDHLDFDTGIWHFPAPKGGVSRAFDIPICPKLAHLLTTYRDAITRVSNSPFIFPAFTPTGYISETKEPRARLGKWGNDLRQTFRTVAYCAQIDDISIHVLMNHKLSSVNAGYLNLAGMWPRLTEAQSSIIEIVEANAKGELWKTD